METRIIKNPTLQDIIFEFDKYGDSPYSLKMPAGEIVEVDEKYAELIIDQIYNAIINERLLNGITLNANPIAKKKIVDEININL